MTATRQTLLPPIGRVPSGLGKETERFLSALKEHVEVSAGRRGDTTDKVVTHREVSSLIQAAVTAAISAQSATGASTNAVVSTTEQILALLDGAITSAQLSEDLADQIGQLVQDSETLADTLDGNLQAFSELTGAADKLPYFTAAETLALTALTTYARTFIAAADKYAASLLLAEPLAAVSSLTPSADKLAYYTSGTTAALTTLSSFIRTLLDDADAIAARATLGLGSIATQAASSVAITGGVIDGTTVGATTATTGRFTTVTSTVATGTAPLAVSSTTAVANLNADLLDGQHASAFLTGNQVITLSGDISGSGATSITATLPNIVTGASKCKITYNAKGQVTAGADLAAGDIPTFLNFTGFSNGLAGSSQEIARFRPTDWGAGKPYFYIANGDAAGKFVIAVWDGASGAGTLQISVDPLITNPTVISVNSASDALRITQIGAGDALVVEDSANPDSTPFVVNNAGRVLVGQSTSQNVVVESQFQINGVNSEATAQLGRWATDANGPIFFFSKSRGGAVGTRGAVVGSDNLGSIRWVADDGTNWVYAAQIAAVVDATPGTLDMPARLVFQTTPDGGSTLTERLSINNAGVSTFTGNVVVNANNATAGLRITQTGSGEALRVEDEANPDSTPFVIGAAGTLSIGGTAAVTINLDIPKALGGGTTTYDINLGGQIQSDCTGAAVGVRSTLTTAAAAFTLGSMYHFLATPAAPGAGSTITNQFGFFANSTLNGATNNYGFYGGLAYAAGDYNFFAAGEAPNYFAGYTGIGGLPLVDLDIYTRTSGNTWCRTNAFGGIALFGGYRSSGTQAAPTAVANGDEIARFFGRGRNAGGTYTSAAEISITANGAPGAGYVPGAIQFLTTSAAGALTQRMTIDSAGLATFNNGATVYGDTGTALRVVNTGSGDSFRVEDQGFPGDSTYFVVDADGNVIIGGSSPAAAILDIQKPIGNVAGQLIVSVGGSVPMGTPDVTGYQSAIAIGSGTYTVNDIWHFKADPAAAGTATLTRQYGFYANVSAASGHWNFYANGSAGSYFNGATTFGTKYGYGTKSGVGGTVTQATSKSTGVTINKICGQITTHNQALAAGAVASFTVTNSTVAALDIPKVVIASGATAGAYDVQVDAVAAGSFRISIRNQSAGSLSEALVLNFAVEAAVNA